jgi:hypothetical protein
MRINLYGGPGSGKSTTAAWLFSELKLHGFSVELVNEFCKSWAYQGRKIKRFDQIYLFGKQHQAEYKCLTNGVKHIVTDSPLILPCIYGEKYCGKEISVPLEMLVKEYDKEFPCYNIFLDRGEKKYIQEGRYESLEQAQEIDRITKAKLIELYGEKSFITAGYRDRNYILQNVLTTIANAS